MVYTNSQGVVVKDKNKLVLFFVALSFAIMSAIGMFLPTLAASTVVVTPDNTQGWLEADVRPDGEVNFVEDSASPYPDGALQLKTDDTNTAKAQYLREESGSLGDIEELSYWTKQVDGPAVASASFQVLVDLNGEGAEGFTTLVFEPYWQNELGDPAPVEFDTWQEWNVLDGGLLWSSSTFTDNLECSVVSGAGGPPLYTLEELTTNCPDAVLLAIGVNVGTFNAGYDIYVDGVTFNGTTYDFELTNNPEVKDDCKKDGWMDYGFRNQGQCIRFVNTGQDSR